MDSSLAVSHIFQIRNAGDGPLKITLTKGSCGCTTAAVSRVEIEPGGKTEITAVFRPDGRAGIQNKYVLVYSDDSAASPIQLNLTGTVVRDVLIEPEALTTGRIRADQPHEMKLLIVNNSARPLHVTGAKADSPLLQTRVTELTAGQKYVVYVTTVPPLENGPMQSIIHVFTDDTNAPVHDVQFEASVLGPLVVVKPKLTFEESREPVMGWFIINAGIVTNFTITKIETPDPAITAQQMNFGANGVRITINNIVPQPALDGKKVRVTTDVPGMETIEIPIEIRPAKKP